MVLGIATGLLGLGLALPTGLAFGYGYGYGVRQGYSAFKQPSKTAGALKMSPDPVQGSLGMGLQTGEERTGVPTPTGTLGRPSLQTNDPLTNKQKWNSTDTNKHGKTAIMSQLSRREQDNFWKGKGKWGPSTYNASDQGYHKQDKKHYKSRH